MSVIRFFILFLAFTISMPVWAGGGILFLRRSGRALVKPEPLLNITGPVYVDRAVLMASSAAQLAQTDRNAFLNSPQTLPFQQMATVSVPLERLSLPARLVAWRNDRIALPWFETIEKDLSFLKAHIHEIRNTLQVKHIQENEMNYADLIPATARKIYVGEEHKKPFIYRAFEQMIFQYQAKYPHRKIIILTEFMSDRSFPWQKAGKPVGGLEVHLRKTNGFLLFSSFLKAGVEVIGLEDIHQVKETEEQIVPDGNLAISTYGMKERNEHWRQIIHAVSEENPEAVLFIYTGSMHSHYRAPFSLATPSPHNFVLQFEATPMGSDNPFGFVMQGEPFIRANPSQLTVLSWPEETVFRTRSGFDAYVIFPGRMVRRELQ